MLSKRVTDIAMTQNRVTNISQTYLVYLSESLCSRTTNKLTFQTTKSLLFFFLHSHDLLTLSCNLYDFLFVPF